MGDSARLYIYGVDYNGNKEFLVSVLSVGDAVKYCQDHSKVFKNRFSSYMYGKPCVDKGLWETWEVSDE